MHPPQPSQVGTTMALVHDTTKGPRPAGRGSGLSLATYAGLGTRQQLEIPVPGASPPDDAFRP
eukprot:7657080-Alexandrium_andersonii.AAC.1